jgi:hypothetical protein
MESVFAYAPPAGFRLARWAKTRRAALPLLVFGCAAVALSGTVMLANAWEAPQVQHPTATSARQQLVTKKSRCASCGVVQAIQVLEAPQAGPTRYEFTVRLRDGSTHISTEAGAFSWRVGDPVQLIGGPARTEI